MKTTRIIIILLICLLMTSLSACGKQPEQISGVYKIGAILPLTGPTATLGEYMKNGIEIAAQQINQSGGVNSVKLDVIYEDSQNDAKTGLAAYRRLKDAEDVVAIIPAMNSVTNAIFPLAQEDKIPLLATTVSAAGITDQSDYLLRLFITADIDAVTMANYAADNLGLNKFAIIYVNDDMGLSFTQVFTDTIIKKSKQITWQAGFDKGQADYKDIITKLKSQDFEAVYILGYEQGLGLLVRQIREFGIEQPILSIATISQPYVIEQVGGVLDNIYFTSTWFNPESPSSEVTKQFVDQYELKFNKKPNYFSGFAYDALCLLAQAIRQNGAVNIKDGLLSIQNYQGVMGNITIQPNGDALFPMEVKKIEKSNVVNIQQ